MDSSPSGAPATSFIVEAGSAAGARDLFNQDVGLITAMTVNVGPATYFVRVRAVTAYGISEASNEAVLTIGVPGQPRVLSASPTGSTLVISWVKGGGGTPTSHRLEFYSDTTHIATLDAGAATTASVVIPPGVQGTFGVRVTAVNEFGEGPASPVLVFDVQPACAESRPPGSSSAVAFSGCGQQSHRARKTASP